MSHTSAIPACLVALALVAAPALAQDATRSSCEVPRIRGAASPGGAVVDVTVVNDGRPCRIRILSDVDAQLAATELRAVDAPSNGRLEFPWPDVALYTPNPGYTGPDTYTFAGRGPTGSGRTAALRVTVRVNVVKP
jgi:hypothetical protein